jgi:hypothetical protein
MSESGSWPERSSGIEERRRGRNLEPQAPKGITSKRFMCGEYSKVG